MQRRNNYKASEQKSGVIKIVGDIAELKKEISESKIEIDVERIVKIDLPFLDNQENFTLISFHTYENENPHRLIFVTGNKSIVYSPTAIKTEKKFDKVMKRKNGESTVMIYGILRSVLRNYSQEFLRIREIMNALDLDPVLDDIETAGRDLRKLTDRLEGLMQIIIELKEAEVDCFNVELVSVDYEILNAEARYWLERCRSHVYRIASLRTKSEMRSNRELNDTMKKLTVIMTFLTIVSIVVNVPGTIGAIFGIPALSEAYFGQHVTFLIITLIFTTILSVLLGFVYWKSLNLKRP